MNQRERLFELLESFGLRNAILPSVLENKAEENQDKVFTIFENQTITYKETNERANRIAHGLLKIKLGRKPKIAVMLPNIPEFLDCWFGITKIRGVIVPVNIYLKGEMLQYILDDSDSEHFIIDHAYLKAFEVIRDRVPKIRTVIVFNAPSSFTTHEEIIDQEQERKILYLRYEALNDPNTTNPDVKIKDFDPMEIMYTSGTTGRPKGVLYRQYFVLAGLLVGNELKEGGIRGDDILYCPLPFFHSFAQFLTIMPTMFVNGKVVVDDRFHATDFWERTARYKATAFCYVGGMLPLLLKQPEKPIDRAHTIRVAYGGGCPQSIWDEFEERFGVKIYEGWSLSEAVGVTLNKAGSEGGKAGSIGTSIEGFMLRIIDSDGKELPPAEDPNNPKPENIGEILTKSTLPISLEYYKQKDVVKKKNHF